MMRATDHVRTHHVNPINPTNVVQTTTHGVATNWASSVEPWRAVVEEVPPVIAICTSSK